jgi:hypothetical protein
MTTLHDELAWRAQADAAMRADDGWLTLAGLFWLHEGVNTFGSEKTRHCLPCQFLPSPLRRFHP